MKTRFCARYQGIIIGWYDTLAAARAAIRAAKKADVKEETAWRDSDPTGQRAAWEEGA